MRFKEQPYDIVKLSETSSWLNIHLSKMRLGS